jgi:pseudaminic acid biosynthesis-associated methylase
VTESKPELVRLEELWSGDFGDDYVDRNRQSDDNRRAFWSQLVDDLGVTRALEVGCNVGGNLRHLAPHMTPGGTFGLDVNRKALGELRRELPEINAVEGSARDLPFRDGWFDLVFTVGVLIHQADSTQPLVMNEMARVSKQWVLCGEYFAEQTEEVPYRDPQGALFRRNCGSLFTELFPQLHLHSTGFLGKDEGWDDVTWWLFSTSSV